MNCDPIERKAIFNLRERDDRPLVSVLVLAYNHEKYIHQALDGILSQETDFAIEIIVGEDCSSDRTREIILEYQEIFPEIVTVIYEDSNVGAHKNLQRVLNHCRGDYIAICEGDDYWIDVEKLSIQVQALMSAPEKNLCFHPTMYLYQDSGKLRGPYCVRRFSSGPVKSETIAKSGGGYIPTASILFRSDSLISEILANGQNYLTGDYLLQTVSGRSGAIYLHRAMSVYRTRNPESWTGRISDDEGKKVQFLQSFHEMICDMRECLPELSRQISDNEVRHAMEALEKAESADSSVLTTEAIKIIEKRMYHCSLCWRITSQFVVKYRARWIIFRARRLFVHYDSFLQRVRRLSLEANSCEKPYQN